MIMKESKGQGIMYYILTGDAIDTLNIRDELPAAVFRNFGYNRKHIRR